MRDCVSTFPSVTPVASRRDRHRARARRAPHPVDELVPPRRGALRRVRLLVPGHARVRGRPLALRHGLQHEHGAPHACAQDGLRAPRRRRPAHRLHHLPDLPRPHPPRALRARASTGASPRRRSSATRSTAPRELFYADLFDSRNTGCTSALGMPGQRDRHTGCVGAYLVEHDLFDFLLFSLPDNDTYSHKARARRPGAPRSPRPTARSSGIMHVAGGVDAFLEEHAVIVMSDHSQTTVEERVNLADALRRLARAAARRPGADRGRAGGLPVGALGAGLRARRGAPRRAGAAAWWRRSRELEGVDLVVLARGRRGAVVRSRARRAALPPGGELAGPARRGAGRVEGERGGARARRRRRRGDERRLPGRPRAALVGARAARTPATCWSRPRRLRVRRLGRRRPRGRRQPRLAAPRRLARACCCSAASDAPRARAVVAHRRDPAGARPLRCTVGADDRRAPSRAVAERPHAGARARARRPAQAAQLGAAGQVLRRRRRPATWST